MSQQREVVEGATLVQWFLTRVRERRASTFDAWLTACQDRHVPELDNFARMLQRDDAAVKATLTVPWSNGQVEGQIHRLT